MQVVDSHVHLTDRSQLGYSWMPGAGLPDKDWTETEFTAAWKSSSVEVAAAVFVEVAVDGGAEATLREAQWILEKIADPSSVFQGLVANIPMADGQAAVETWLQKLKETMGDKIKGLKGARQVPVNGALLSKTNLPPVFLEGVRAVGKAGLSVDLVIKPACCEGKVADICVARQIAEECPGTTIVLDHLAYGCGNLEHFQTEIGLLAKHPNVVVKLCALEEWEENGHDGNFDPYLDFALQTFGFDRCLFESNWFVCEAMNFSYERIVALVKASLQRCGASEADIAAVFGGNARRVYKLE